MNPLPQRLAGGGSSQANVLNFVTCFEPAPPLKWHFFAQFFPYAIEFYIDETDFRPGPKLSVKHVLAVRE